MSPLNKKLSCLGSKYWSLSTINMEGHSEKKKSQMLMLNVEASRLTAEPCSRLGRWMYGQELRTVAPVFQIFCLHVVVFLQSFLWQCCRPSKSHISMNDTYMLTFFWLWQESASGWIGLLRRDQLRAVPYGHVPFPPPNLENNRGAKGSFEEREAAL